MDVRVHETDAVSIMGRGMEYRLTFASILVIFIVYIHFRELRGNQIVFRFKSLTSSKKKSF